MKVRCKDFKCLVKKLSFQGLALLVCAFPYSAYGEDTTDLEYGYISVPAGEQGSVNDSSIERVSGIFVGEGGHLTINSSLSLDNGDQGAIFENAGTVTVSVRSLNLTNPAGMTEINNTGILEIVGPAPVNEDSAGLVSSTSGIFNRLRRNGGKIVIGNPNAESPSMYVLQAGVDHSLNLDASQFAASPDAEGSIVMRERGNLFLQSQPTTITGNTLEIGPIKYQEVHQDVRDGRFSLSNMRMSRVRGTNITLTPDNAEMVMTLQSGMLQFGSGLKSSDPIDGPEADVVINGTLNVAGGAIVLGTANENPNSEGTIKGNIVIGQDDVAVKDSAFIAQHGEWFIDGDMVLNKSGYIGILNPSTDSNNSFNTSLEINGNFIIRGQYNVNGYTLKVNNAVKADAESVISVENSDKLQLANINMNGGQINFDPPFIKDGDLSNASMGVLTFDASNVDARINIGQNSMVTLGSTDPEWLRTKIAEYQIQKGILWGRDITAALAIRSPQTLASVGGLNVDGTWTNSGSPATANKARFADKSLFVIDAAGVGSQTVLDGNGTGALIVESGSKVLITDAAVGDEIKVTDNFSSSEVSPQGWTANASTSTDLLVAEGELINASRGEYRFRIKEGQNSTQSFSDLSNELALVVDKATSQGLDTNAGSTGTRFISRAVDNRYIGSSDKRLAAATIESAARMAVVGAVPQMTIASNNAAGAAITQRTSLAQPKGALQSTDASGNIVDYHGFYKNGLALWVMPLYQSANGFSLEAGNFDYDFSGALGGVALGADYTFENALRAGLSFNIGGGYAKGTGELNRTINNMNFWGAGAYVGWRQNNFGLAADVNYTSTYNKLKQDIPASMQMCELKSDISAWAISTGLRAEYKIENDYVNVTPHAGFRFINLGTDSYDIKSNGGKVVNGDSLTQNIWTFPIGLSFSQNYDLKNNWRIKPLLDLNVTPATGDIRAKTKVRFTGIDQEAEIDTKMMDYVTYGGTAGMEFSNGTVSIGLDYSAQFGAETSAHGIFGTLRFEF